MTIADIVTNDHAGKIVTELKVLMTSYMGITRNAESLEQILIQIQQWQQWLEKTKLNQSDMSTLDDTITADELTLFQLARQLQLATLVIQSAYQRYESRGGHYRQDYPHLASTPRTSVIESPLNLSYKQCIYFDKSIKNPQNSYHSID